MKRGDIKWELDPTIKKSLDHLTSKATQLWQDPEDKLSFEVINAVSACIDNMKYMSSAKSAIGFHSALTALTKALQQHEATVASNHEAKALFSEIGVLSKFAQQSYSPPSSPREDQPNKRSNYLGQHRFYNKPTPDPKTDEFKVSLLKAKNAAAEGFGTTPEQDKILKQAEKLENNKHSPGRGKR